MLKNFILKNFWLKFLALFIAIFIWAIVMSEQKSEALVQAKINIEKPDDLVITNDIIKEVSVTIYGQHSLVRRCRLRKLEAKLDLRNASPGLSLFRILPEKINAPRSVEIVSINPSTIFIKLDEKIKRRVLVKPKFTGTLPLGYILTGYKISPDSVVLEGAKSDLLQLNEVFLEPIDLSEKKQNVKEKALLELPGKNIWQIKEEEFRVEVRIEKRS